MVLREALGVYSTDICVGRTAFVFFMTKDDDEMVLRRLKLNGQPQLDAVLVALGFNSLERRTNLGEFTLLCNNLVIFLFGFNFFYPLVS